MAQTYAFEGRWEQNGNGCEQPDVYSSRGDRSYGDKGTCRFTSLTRQRGGAWRYAVSCDGDAGRYTSSGMAGLDRMRVLDRLMPGQTTEYSRCR